MFVSIIIIIIYYYYIYYNILLNGKFIVLARLSWRKFISNCTESKEIQLFKIKVVASA